MSLGVRELDSGETPLGRVRRAGGGRKRVVDRNPPAFLASDRLRVWARPWLGQLGRSNRCSACATRPRSPPVTRALHSALIEAMERLLAGAPSTVTAASPSPPLPARRASRGRPSTGPTTPWNSSGGVLANAPADLPAALPERIQELQGQLREARRACHEEITEFRQSVDTLAQRAQALTLDNERLRTDLPRQGTVQDPPP